MEKLYQAMDQGRKHKCRPSGFRPDQPWFPPCDWLWFGQEWLAPVCIGRPVWEKRLELLRTLGARQETWSQTRKHSKVLSQNLFAANG